MPTRPAKKAARRTRANVNVIKDAMIRVLKEDKPMTVRQVFYRLVSEGVIGKTEAEYKTTVCRLLKELRVSKTIPYQWIADSTRWVRRPTTHSSLQALLEDQADVYRRSVWDDQDAYVEIWLEKDALAGVLVPVTDRWDVPLLVTRGYPSISYVHAAAEQIAAMEKPTYIYYFGDRDPSGVDIPRSVEKALRDMAPDAEINFEIVAVTPDQIVEMKLPTRPTKKTDSRCKNFEGESVEVDAIAPKTLRNIVNHCIVQHIDQDRYSRLMQIEEVERETLRSIAWDHQGDDEEDLEEEEDEQAEDEDAD